MKKIWIILPCFKVGGVEKWAEQVYLALRNKYEIEVYVTGDIDRRALEIFPVMNVRAISSFSLACKGVAKRPDFVISALTPANVLVSILFGPLRTKVITSIHLTLGRVSSKSSAHQIYRIFAHFLIRIASTKVIAVSRGVKKDFCKLGGAHPDNVEVVYNPCFEVANVKVKPNHVVENKLRFVAVGRFDEQKNFYDLVQSFLRALDYGCDYYLDIFGDGPDFQRVFDLVPDKYIERVKFRGNQPNILDRLVDYDIFVLPSRYEGFGNVLAEALSVGLFCVARDCPHGPYEILKKGDFGKLVDQQADFGEVLMNLRASYDEFVTTLLKDNGEILNNHLQQFTNEFFAERLVSLIGETDKNN
jgi:glycosyltransferase involved in cell wall biosynthesis